jgi:hypothetical protein
MPAARDDLIGESLAGGRYTIAAKLGEGGMGFVYSAHDRNLDADVVIKVPRRAMLEDPEFADRFAREVRALVKLSHPNIVKISDVGDHDGLPFAVMQYLNGGSLDERRRYGPDGRPALMGLETLRGWLPGVAAALDFVHKQGYIHRDVKPANVLFDAAGHVFLSDFGVAKVLASTSEAAGKALTGTGMVLGTPEYMAPELIMGQPSDGRVDQYALAVTIYELLAGRRPFEGPTPTAILVQQTTQEPPPLHRVCPTIPELVAAAVHRGLAKDPAARHPDCLSLARAVLAAARDAAPAPAPAAGGPAARLECPTCARPLTVPETARGRRTRCPSCATTLRVAPDLSGLVPDTGGSSPSTVAARPPSGMTVPAVRPPSSRTVVEAPPLPVGPAPASTAPATPRPATAVMAGVSLREPDANPPAGPAWAKWAIRAGFVAAHVALLAGFVSFFWGRSQSGASPPAPPTRPALAARPAATAKEQLPEGLLRSADASLARGQIAEAKRSLERYLAHPGAAAKDRARTLLDQIDLATSEARAEALLRSLSDADLAAFAAQGKLPALERIDSPLLREQAVALLRGHLAAEQGRRVPVAPPPAVVNVVTTPAPASPPAPPPLAPEVLRGPIESVLQDPAKYADHVVIPAEYFLLGTRMVRQKDGTYATTIKTKTGTSLCDQYGTHKTDLAFAIDERVAVNLSTFLTAKQSPTTLRAYFKGILTLEIRRVQGAWTALVTGIEYLVRMDEPSISKYLLPRAFLTVRVTTSGAALGYGDGDDWVARLGGKHFVDRVRRDLKDAARRQYNAQLTAEMDRMMGPMMNAAIRQYNADLNQRIQIGAGGGLR